MTNQSSNEQNLGRGYYYEMIAGGYKPVLDIKPVNVEGELASVFGRAHNVHSEILQAPYPYPGVKRIISVNLIPSSLEEFRRTSIN